MRFTTSTIALLTFFSLASACVRSYVTVYDDGKADTYLIDDSQLKCTWYGQYLRGSEQFLNCISGYASWINISVGTPNGVQAYAYNGLNLKWALPARRNPGTWDLSVNLYGCTAKELEVVQWNGKEPSAEIKAAIEELEQEAVESQVARRFNAWRRGGPSWRRADQERMKTI